MKQREIRDEDGTAWTCVQAFSGGEGRVAREAQAHAQRSDGAVPVVCTPGGGKQSVRLDLPAGWEDELADGELIRKIAAACGNR